MEEKLINQAADRSEAHYKPYGWHHWPDYPWMSYQFRRALGETQEGGGAISECFQVASRIDPSDSESWHREWLRVGDRNRERGDAAEANGHIVTAQNSWLRAVDYYREAEFWLAGDDPRRLAVFDKLEECTAKWGQYLNPALEPVEIPYLDGKNLYAYFLRSPVNSEKRQPVLMCFGGLDSFKDEMWFMVAHGAIQRGISVLMVDGPGQGGTIRRHGIVNRYDYEVPVGKCIDYLETRDDVDPKRIAMSGSSLGGYYAARAASFEHRLAAAVSHGAIWSVNDLWGEADDSHGLAGHIRWVFGVSNMREAFEKGKDFKLEGVIDKIRCPYLIVHGGYDVLGVDQATKVYEYAKANGVNVTLDLIGEEETGAEHCQHDNPTLGQERVNDWLADVFGIDQRALLKG
ncbi:dipeptidyl aminopeptidase/acylaminoacyl peptidase [Natronocella acetinitrilica]|uniref:Dipeptidyl aminopeptidase/acylaminoacyl peptidase n=1 Tax=Natronocella acetinitrilica TaxID=414046 RepID=A0AAE3KF63_9GAMM|nr:alpha/beta fold hydrolase [Natronocella acetinitrilica]MCP1673762.1 dipeptidyl aminopeptidase/acylaminoacyl peptidase [Natronocella acetinitrilica]